ncbi:hypothetical protein PoB_002402700 [Plakobranchus ocellatus]|uniref:Uncharacterized protein n=1 Tax=Plakobranchus ocellatus TaxID=259542 RepID=A0AAV3ZSJ8_9GAST|nr:hypothetical protein PoB_002402700 [Plakobranchus ocellatus]
MPRFYGVWQIQGSPAGYMTALVMFLYGTVTISGVKAQTKRRRLKYIEISILAQYARLSLYGKESTLSKRLIPWVFLNSSINQLKLLWFLVHFRSSFVTALKYSTNLSSIGSVPARQA